MSLRDLTIKAKLRGLIIFFAVGLALVMGLAWYLLANYRVGGPVYKGIASDKDLLADMLPPPLFIRGVYVALQEMETATEPGDVRNLVEQFRAKETEYNQRRNFWLRELPPGEARQAVEVEIHEPAARIFQIAHAEYLPLIGKGGESQAKVSAILRDKIGPLFRQQEAAVERASKALVESASKREAEAVSATGTWVTVLLIVGIASVLVTAVSGWLLIRGIVGPTNVLIGRVNEMAGGAGDLTARVVIDSKDEIGQLAAGINAMIAKIQAVVQKVRESSIQLLSTASEIAATAHQQEATMQELGASTSEIAAAVREISATSQELSGTMGEVNERSNQAKTLATSGRGRLSNMEATMQQLVESTNSISAKLALIREKADNINMVVTTITKVADQTNLLSINAAIEAEKAGEYGRGFLVVAREIRRLADQTAVATLDIENMVRLMHESVSAGVMQMDKFSEEVRRGVSRVAEINGQTGQIIEEVSGLSDRFHLVNEGMRNQATGAQQINDAMVNMAAGARQTAASLEEFKKATAHLRHSVELLNQEVGQFTA